MNTKQKKIVVFSDIDGTILDEQHSGRKIKPLIKKITDLGVTLILCSSKTTPEIELYLHELEIISPFIVENGGAIIIPKDYFTFSFSFSKKVNGYYVIELGLPYSVVREKLDKVLLGTNCKIIGFRDVTKEQLATELAIPVSLAELAKMREYDEPFRFISGDKKKFMKVAEAEGLTLVLGNKYFHALANTDKGKAVSVTKQLLTRKFGSIMTYGIGDSENDLSMLSVVDEPMLIRKELGGENANLAVWNNLLSIIIDKQT
ncbi:MAG: HAD-IIB family hydrolase [Chloroflexota bacterium]